MSTLAETYKTLHVDLKHIIPLDFNSLNKVPDSHFWPEINDSQSKYHSNDNSEENPSKIPSVDLLAPNVVQLIGHACEKWGIFQVTNHGIPSSVLDDVEFHARRLFSLPLEVKMKALRSPTGASGYGAARISPFFKKLFWHEGFTIMGSPVDHARELWPHDYQPFCEAMENYQKKVKALSFQIFKIILESLGATEDEIKRYTSSAQEPEGALQLNSYPSCPNPKHALGLAPHTDSLLLTILHPSHTNGLQIFKEGQGWIPMPRVAGGLIVNLGDLLHIISNGEFPTVYHRVVVNEFRHRFSAAYFYAPPADFWVGPLSRFLNPKYQCLKVKEFILLKGSQLEKVFSFIRNEGLC